MATTRSTAFVVTAAIWNAVLSGLNDAGNVFTGVSATLSGALSAVTGMFSGAVSIGGTITCASALPIIKVNETDAAANEKIWYWQTDAGVFRLYLANDAETAFTSVFSIDRTAIASAAFGFGPMESATFANGGSGVGINTTLPGNAESTHILLVQDPAASTNSTGTWIQLGRNSFGGKAGTLRFVRAGAAAIDSIWSDDAGLLRTNTSPPSNAVSDTAGTVVGAQVSTRATKNVHGEFTDYAGALDAILHAPVWEFDYKNGAYNRQRFVGITTDDSPVFGMDEGRSFNPVTAFGYTVAAFKALAADNADLRSRIARLEAMVAIGTVSGHDE